MGTKKHKPEEVVAKLRQVDVLVSQGQSVADVARMDREVGHWPPVPKASRHEAAFAPVRNA